MENVGTILAWFDLETTGLDPKEGRILEYAVVFTDLELRRLATMSHIVKQDVEGAKALMNDYCLKMHAENGLLNEIEAAGLGGCLRYEDHLHLADMMIANTAKKLKDKYTDYESPIRILAAGSNILFDVGYVMEHMPQFADVLDHRPNLGGPTAYRVLDVSVYKMGFPHIFGKAETTSVAHRAMQDIEASITKHQIMRRLVLAGDQDIPR